MFANRIFHQNRIKYDRSETPKMTNGLIQHITVEKSASKQWVKRHFYKEVLKLMNCGVGSLKIALLSPFSFIDKGKGKCFP